MERPRPGPKLGPHALPRSTGFRRGCSELKLAPRISDCPQGRLVRSRRPLRVHTRIAHVQPLDSKPIIEFVTPMPCVSRPRPLLARSCDALGPTAATETFGASARLLGVVRARSAPALPPRVAWPCPAAASRAWPCLRRNPSRSANALPPSRLPGNHAYNIFSLPRAPNWCSLRPAAAAVHLSLIPPGRLLLSLSLIRDTLD